MWKTNTAAERAALREELESIRATAAMLSVDLDPRFGGNGTAEEVARIESIVRRLNGVLQ